MRWRLSANGAFFGGQRDKFTRYQPDRDLEEKLALVAQVPDLDGVELRYPADFADVDAVEGLLAEHGLALSAVNVDTKDAKHFRHGALSARSDEARGEAVRRLRAGKDIAARLGCDLVTTCPLADGYDYPFQTEYAGAWQRLVETVRQVAEHRPEVRFCLEFQPTEPHARILLSNVGKVLHACAESGCDNVGANLDIGHSFAAGESPAESAALLASAGRLFYIHTNDNTGEGGDWDMISGSVHLWHWVELLHTLDRLGYDGWLGADIRPKHVGPVELFTGNVRMLQRMWALLERADRDALAELVERDGNTPEVYERLSRALGEDTA
ncbi:MAG: sugar phosphate isomerase/epimerase family protein [Candidatus Brocadiia bacterium]